MPRRNFSAPPTITMAEANNPHRAILLLGMTASLEYAAVETCVPFAAFLDFLDFHVHFEGRFAIGKVASHRAGCGSCRRRRRPGPSVWLLQRGGFRGRGLGDVLLAAAGQEQVESCSSRGNPRHRPALLCLGTVVVGCAAGVA
jgi:hypothetical protein